MKTAWLLCGIALLAICNPAPADVVPGKVTGGRAHELPGWFKRSFLNFEEEVQELRQHGRHLLVFIDLNDCPYCARTLDENFRSGDNMEYIQKNFDVIAINIRGSQEVTWIDKATYSEQQLARKLRVLGTPSLVFIDADGDKVLQLNGYRTPPTLRQALEFVHTNAYRQQSLSDYIEKKKLAPVYTLLDHPRFESITDFSRIRQPLLVIFENRDCSDCPGFHHKVLNHPDVASELKPFRVVRLDSYSETSITDISGKHTTPRAWAATLGLVHRPGVVLFDDGKEIARIEGRFYHFHFKEMLRYVSGGYYKRYKAFDAYLNERQPELLQQGTNIDFGE